jgi:hypothetical protein
MVCIRIHMLALSWPAGNTVSVVLCNCMQPCMLAASSSASLPYVLVSGTQYCVLNGVLDVSVSVDTAWVYTMPAASSASVFHASDVER